MKRLVFITLLLSSGVARATDYHLESDKQCISAGSELQFKCQPATEKYKVFIYSSGARWFKKHVWENPRSETKWELFVVKSDENILVLSEDVLFSGTRLLSILKKTSKFVQTEVAYASFGNEVSVTFGRVYKTSE
jgi:hypothetical protein